MARFKHIAVTCPCALVDRVQSGLSGWCRGESRHELDDVWRDLHTRWERARNTRLVEPSEGDRAEVRIVADELDAPWPKDTSAFRRPAWERLRSAMHVFALMKTSGLPDIVVAGHGQRVREALAAVVAEPDLLTPPPPSQRHVPHEPGAAPMTFPDPWEVLERLVQGCDPYDQRNIGMDGELDAFPRFQAFHDAHPEVWPETGHPLDNEDIGFDRNTVARDHYQDPALWEPEVVQLPRLVFQPVGVTARVSKLLGGRIGVGTRHVGVGTLGGPLYVGHGEELMAAANRLSALDAPQGLEAVVSAWASRLTQVPEGTAVLSYVHLDPAD